VIIQDRATRHVTGHVGLGNMLLNELFSPSEKKIKKYDPEVDYLDDLKFWISNNDDLVSKVLMPAVKKHKEHRGNTDGYKFYLEPIKKCCNLYCDKFDLSDSKNEIFGPNEIIKLAKKIASEQTKYIDKGDYKNEIE